MAKLNYIVTSASNTFSGGVCDTDMYFPFAGGKKKGGTISTPIVSRQVLDETWGYMTEEEFEALDDLEYLGFDGDSYVYSDGRGRQFFKNVGTKIGGAASWLVKKEGGLRSAIKDLVTRWGKAINERRTNRKAKKSEKQANAEKKAKDKVKAQGGSEADANKAGAKAGFDVKQQEEAIINNAESKAYEAAKAAGKAIEEVEKAANQAGEQAEKQIYGGYLAGEDKDFWKSMGVGGKVAIIGGGALFIGLIVYLVVKKK
jgi:Sec-independent protein translocase protein TatA